MVVRVARDEVVAFRLQAHHLTERLAEDRLLEAAGRCAVQNSPPGSASLALHARVEGVGQGRMAEAVADEKSLLQTWCMRGAPFVFPTADAPVFTRGVLPPTEASMRHLLPGVEQPLRDLDMSLTDAVELTHAAVGEVLPGRRLAINPLGVELAEQVAGKLPAQQRRLWQAEGPFSPGQPLGEGVIHFCLRILTLQGVVCFAPRTGNTAPFVLVEEWLGHPIPAIDPEQARADLLRRYIRCYGPSTRRDFAAWVGVRAADVDPWWTPVERELTPVEFRGRCCVLTEDLDRLRSAPPASGVRLLPPHDPYTQMRDRDTIVDPAYQGLVWRTPGAPGTVLVDGEICGTWRPSKRRDALTISMTVFDSLPARARQSLEDEAEGIAKLRGASSVTVTYPT